MDFVGKYKNNNIQIMFQLIVCDTKLVALRFTKKKKTKKREALRLSFITTTLSSFIFDIDLSFY